MTPLAAGLGYLDLLFRGRPGAIATAVVHGPGGVALIDPGPSSCLARLEFALQGMGIALRDVRDVLLTHIHLDHAGATGALVRAHPHIVVHVHERGGPHLAAPQRLLASARQLWGEELEPLWGSVTPVPSANLRPLSGERSSR